MELFLGFAITAGAGYWYIKRTFGSVAAFKAAADKAKAARSVI